MPDGRHHRPPTVKAYMKVVEPTYGAEPDEAFNAEGAFCGITKGKHSRVLPLRDSSNGPVRLI
jgi:hypothetical protein